MEQDLEQLVRAELADTAEALTPSAAPVGRLVGRGRAVRRRRRVGAVAALVTVAALAGVGVRSAGGLGHVLGDRDARPVHQGPEPRTRVGPGAETFAAWVAGLPVAADADTAPRWDAVARRVRWEGRSHPLPGPDAAGWDDVRVGWQTSRGLMVLRGSSVRAVAQLGRLDRSGGWTWQSAVALVSMPVLSPDRTRYAAVEFDRLPQTVQDVGRLVVRDVADDRVLSTRPVSWDVDVIVWNRTGIVAQRLDRRDSSLAATATARGRAAGEEPGVLVYDPVGTATPHPVGAGHILLSVDARTGPWTTDRLVWLTPGSPCGYVATPADPDRHLVELCPPMTSRAALAPDGRHAVLALDLLDLGTGARTRLDARAPAAQLLPQMDARWIDDDTVLVAPQPGQAVGAPPMPVAVRCRISTRACEVVART